MSKAKNPLLQQANNRIIAHYLVLDAQGHLPNAPKTDDELYEFIALAYGIKLPRKVITEGHKSQFQFVADLFFEREKNVLAFANRTGGKCLDVTTPILTTSGFKQLADIRQEDYVYGTDGKPARVYFASDTYNDHRCYKVVFDSETLIANADHIWEVRRAKQLHYQLLTTEQIFDFLKNPPRIGYKNLFTARLTQALQIPTVDLPVHPYVLGMYLGDGCRSTESFSSNDPEIVDRIQQLYDGEVRTYNVRNRCPTFRLYGIHAKLESYSWLVDGVKCVPYQYLRASEEQRLELLRGLMDSDGYPCKDRSRLEFDTTDYPLASAVKYLVASLGGKAFVSARGPGSLDGYAIYKDRYRVSFYPFGKNPFWLPRKAKYVGSTYYKNREHILQRVEHCESVPVRCLGVENDSNMFLAGSSLVPTHNTYAVALINHLDMIFKPGCEIASAGAVRDQADKCYRYFQSFLEFPWFKDLNQRFQDCTGKPLLDDSIKSKTQFNSVKDKVQGSMLEIITGTDKGLRGPHPNKARIDEVDLIEWTTLQTALSMSHSSDGIVGQNVFTSTRQLQDGSMQRLLDEAKDKGIAVYEWDIWEAVEKCNRRCKDDAVHGSCPIYTFCKGKAHHCDGFYKIDDFIDKVRLIDRETFETEWENKRPSRHKMVYPSFSHSRHVMTPERLYRMTGSHNVEFNWYKVSGLDFGSSPGHPFVYLKACMLPNNAWMIFHEYVAEQRLIRDHAQAIRSSPFYYSGETIYADWDAQDRLELKACGVRTQPAVKGNNTVSMGIDHVKTLLNGYPPEEIPQLYVWHDCTNTIREFGVYQWPTRPDGKVDRTGQPVKDNDHCMDTIRYILYSLRRKGGQKYHSYNIPGI